MTLEEYRAAYDREEDFGQVTKELIQAWLDERIEAVKQIEEIKKSMDDYPLVWGRLIDGEYENTVDLCGWTPELRLHIYEGIEHIADVLGITLECECHPANYKLPFPSNCLGLDIGANSVTGKVIDSLPSNYLELKRSHSQVV